MKAAIVMGSDSDLPVMNEAVKTLNEFGVGSYVSVTSAHRTPDKVAVFLAEAEKQGCEVIIAAAGMAAHLAGVMAAATIKPVIAVPMPGGALNGVDALYSMVQMPQGIPVATVAIGKAGAVNAAILAVQIMAVKDPALKEKLVNFKKKMADTITKKDAELNTIGVEEYINKYLQK